MIPSEPEGEYGTESSPTEESGRAREGAGVSLQDQSLRLAAITLDATRELVEARERIAALEAALRILAKRQCGSYCTDKDADGIPRYKEMERRCAACIALAALAAPAKETT
jgi:hypothetical protein